MALSGKDLQRTGLWSSHVFTILISDILTKLLLNFVPNVFVAIRVDMHVSLIMCADCTGILCHVLYF